MMKKKILVILIVIGVLGVLIYLLKDRLKALLGEKAKGEEIPEETKKGIVGPVRPPSIGQEYLGLKRWVQPGTIIGRTGESPARWLIEEIAPILKPMYPQRYRAIVKGLFAYLVKGETALPPDQEVVTQISPYHEPTGPHSWALPQF